MRQDIDRVKQRVRGVVGDDAGLPTVLTTFATQLAQLEEASRGADMESPMSLGHHLGPILAVVASYYRKRRATEIEDSRARALTGELIGNLDAELAELDGMLTSTWCQSAERLSIPRLRDFISEDRPTVSPVPAPSQPRRYDDKFNILLSASGLLNNLRTLRLECEARSAQMSIAFLDVDHLKDANTKIGETWVDALVLPPLMRVVERATFGHGEAYRYGGDEFVILIPSASETVSVALLRSLRAQLAAVKYEQFDQSFSVSVGLCQLQPDSPLTDREALHWAALAKRKAKERRNCIALVTAGTLMVGEPNAIILED